MPLQRVGSLDELKDAGRLMVEADHGSIGVFLVDGEVLALRNQCPHQGGPVCQGILLQALRARLDERGRPKEYWDADQTVVCCPWHGIEFDVRTGRSLAHPTWRLRMYTTSIDGDDVFLELPTNGD